MLLSDPCRLLASLSVLDGVGKGPKAEQGLGGEMPVDVFWMLPRSPCLPLSPWIGRGPELPI